LGPPPSAIVAKRTQGESKMRGRLWWLPWIMVPVLLGATAQAGPAFKKLKDTIEVRAQGDTLHYREASLYSKQDFAQILKEKEGFKSTVIASLKRRYGWYVLTPKVMFNEEESTVTVQCLIKGAMYAPKSYDFHWLLKDLPFDLYQFKEQGKGLVYDGTIEGVPTIIRLQFPYEPAHCHEHVWPRWK